MSAASFAHWRPLLPLQCRPMMVAILRLLRSDQGPVAARVGAAGGRAARSAKLRVIGGERHVHATTFTVSGSAVAAQYRRFRPKRTACMVRSRRLRAEAVRGVRMPCPGVDSTGIAAARPRVVDLRVGCGGVGIQLSDDALGARQDFLVETAVHGRSPQLVWPRGSRGVRAACPDPLGRAAAFRSAMSAKAALRASRGDVPGTPICFPSAHHVTGVYQLLPGRNRDPLRTRCRLDSRA
jgi:hypothetical protein